MLTDPPQKLWQAYGQMLCAMLLIGSAAIFTALMPISGVLLSVFLLGEQLWACFWWGWQSVW